jgi:hypothetical protein
MEFITLAVISFICLLFESTRKFGCALFIVLFVVFPLSFIALAAITIHFINRQQLKRRKHYVPPTLPRSH